MKKINKLLKIRDKIKKKDFTMNEDCHIDYFYSCVTKQI